MRPGTRLAALAVLALLLGTALAQARPAPDTATLLQRIEEQDKRIEALEHKLGLLESQEAAAATYPGAAGAAAQRAAGQLSAQQSTAKPPAVPQTTGATPSSPSTAVQGATAAVSQRAATANEAPGLVSAGSVKAGPAGFSFASEDGANVIRF
ncbi:MAG: hypothetical protein ACRETD_09075, partial [Steroidobacteraceae bacterium]